MFNAKDRSAFIIAFFRVFSVKESRKDFDTEEAVWTWSAMKFVYNGVDANRIFRR
jgi:hypothetical protein